MADMQQQVRQQQEMAVEVVKKSGKRLKVHGDNVIDHVEDAEENLVELGLKSLLEESNLQSVGCEGGVLRERLVLLRNVLMEMEDVEVEHVDTVEQFLRDVEFNQGVVRGVLECLLLSFCLVVYLLWLVSWDVFHMMLIIMYMIYCRNVHLDLKNRHVWNMSVLQVLVG